jgi:hypothetical protein
LPPGGGRGGCGILLCIFIMNRFDFEINIPIWVFVVIAAGTASGLFAWALHMRSAASAMNWPL